MNECLFCKIIRGEVPSYKIYEDNYTYAFLDISKDCYGHTLVVPKAHYENIYDADETTLSHIMETTKKIASHYKQLGFDGINIINNSGKNAEQSVMHIHFHLFPRKENDNISISPNLKNLDMSLEDIQKNLQIK